MVHPSQEVIYGNLVFGVLLAAGGIVGYARARSVPSLVAGVGCGLAVFAAAYYLQQGQVNGYYIASGTSLLVLASMGSRFIRTRKFMPAGLVALLSAAVGGYTFNELINQK